MNCQVRSAEDISIIDCSGEVDLNSSWQLHDALLSEMHTGTPGVLVNLSDVTYMDSSGVAMLVEGLQLSRETKTRFGLFGLRTGTRSVLEMARLDRIFVIFENEHEALEGIWQIEPFGGR
jgi:anti-sigma B factor antagonist